MRALILLPLLLAAACGSEKPKTERPAPMVSAVAATPRRFVDSIQAVGTARAREQVTLAAPVTERIVSLNFTDGGYVRAGQVVARLAQAEETAQLAQARASERETEQQLARLQRLRERGFATNATLDTQLAAAASARAQAAQARATIGDRVIVAPFSGYASLRMLSVGAVVTAGTEIAQISDISQIKLDFPVPETILTQISQGQTIEARAAAFGDRPFRGSITTIDPVVDPATRSVLVRALLPNPDRLLKPGMLLTVAIQSRPRSGLAVPELAVVGEGERRFVFRIEGDTAKRVPVRTGTRDAGLIEIVEGLSAGDRVVGDGVVKVADGMKIRIEGQEAAQGPARGAAKG
ncbi:efflux RND transporter periplasmic adaptor subunit [Sphingomonas jatrophae]|uniref:Membrane fusion protein, multidrug efflux system n=1 Tax=Sphingomonas jatrophae TaxID=1166337 RepID=A0A1I6M975_9SPHN|nr:efflux RND transporter periplasmic adaptor subunit [Sphingomonas jatrophae]SFS12082.1 membrane fusion protein, multidrug efflux system [Sphingomonas jatrophae]